MSAESPAWSSQRTTPFHDLTDYVAIPRVGSLRLAPDGSWLAAAVQTLSSRREEVPDQPVADRPGRRPGPAADPVRRRRGRPEVPAGRIAAVHLPRRSRIPGPARASPAAARAPRPRCGCFPRAAARPASSLTLPGGVSGAEAAAGAGTVVVSSPVLPGAQAGPDESTAADDARRRQERSAAGVTAILHESAPVRFWDHDLGPDQLRLFAVEEAGLDEPAAAARAGHPDPASGSRDLTPEPGRALDEESFGLTPDGASVLTGWWQWHPAGESHAELVLIDVASGKRQVLLSVPEYNFQSPRVSPDGRLVVCLRERQSTPELPPDTTLVVLGLDGTGGSGEAGRDLLPGLDRWPAEAAWSPDSRAVYFTADDSGRRPVFRVDVQTAEVTQLTGDDGVYSDLNPAPDGRYLYALRSAVDSPPAPVRIDLDADAAAPIPLAAPGVPLSLPGRVEEVEAAADDGQPIRSWLVLPDGACSDRPAPLLLWVHGGPMSSWNGWSWRWNPWLMAARGYAVLLPDPALSTGYGQQFIARGYHSWGDRPLADIMAVTEPVRGPPGHRRRPRRHDGRLLRRLHGQLDRRSHRPLQGHREPRGAVGAGPDVRHHRPSRCSGGRSSVTRSPSPRCTRPTPRTGTSS